MKCISTCVSDHYRHTGQVIQQTVRRARIVIITQYAVQLCTLMLKFQQAFLQALPFCYLNNDTFYEQAHPHIYKAQLCLSQLHEI